MKQQAMRTAVTLYGSGTLDLQSAARQAGVAPDRLRYAVRRAGGSVPAVSNETDRVRVRAD